MISNFLFAIFSALMGITSVFLRSKLTIHLLRNDTLLGLFSHKKTLFFGPNSIETGIPGRPAPLPISMISFPLLVINWANLKES